MIAFLTKVTMCLSALVQLVKAAVVIIRECKNAFTDIKDAVTGSTTNVGTINSVSTVSAEETPVANTEVEKEAFKVFTFNEYPEVDLSLFEGKMFSWEPSTDTA